ncbi:neutral zinc metallopeptidase [Streptosporangium sp. NPDC023615]|uniref:neutral zinc metallopeptidase n=1 Tax=Streptosporangium sp. NPDC023615 TaxID=3154794 RepID=UPI003433728C
MLSGTAHATVSDPAPGARYPIRDSVLTKNKLYRSGELTASECPEREIQAGSVPSAKRYLTSVLNCLNTAWGAHFKKARIPFSKSRIAFSVKPKRFCGYKWEKDTAAAYCGRERRFLVKLDKEVLEDPSDLVLFSVAAHEYGHHVQTITGMERAFDYYPYKGKRELGEQIRRYELQAECLAGVFMGSVWESLDRTEEDWEFLLEVTRDNGDERYKSNHGKGRTIATWLDKGFRAASPAACNTWPVPSSKVR